MIEILHQGSSFVVVDKPAGLPTQAPSPHESLETRCRNAMSLSVNDYLTPVHRLDRVVGGVVLFATTKKAARTLSEQFANRIVAKTYLAIVEGNPFGSRTPGILQTWVDCIAKVPDQARACVVVLNAATSGTSASGTSAAENGKEAITKAALVGFDAVRDRSLIRLRPETGRMHQLRVQLAERGYPILGDDLYGSTVQTPDAKMIALHSESLTFRDPSTAKWLTCRSLARSLTDLIDPGLLPLPADG